MTQIVTPRRWQAVAINQFVGDVTRGRKNWLAYVTPGAGKTWFTLQAVKRLQEIREIKQVAVVVHTTNLKSQWITSADEHGLSITEDIGRDGDGFVMTYQQLARDSEKVRKAICGTRRALVVFDEGHHLSDEKTWGDNCVEAFGPCWRRLLLSGTPFRGDSEMIPFITYRDGSAIADFVYGYSAALADGVVPPVYFPTYGGSASWKIGDEEYSSSADPSSAESIRRLNTMIASSQWLSTVLQDANERLTELRVHQPDAAGLVVCRDQSHARTIQTLLERHSLKVQLAISDDASSHDTIEAFRYSNDRWLVAVRMVSEGVNIPRLRVGVYASNYRSELFFRQVVGRFVRLDDRYMDQSAFLYLPDHPDLARYAQELVVDRLHILGEASQSRRPYNRIREGQRFEALDATALAGVTILPGSEFDSEELRIADMVRRSAGLGYLPVEVVASLLRAQANLAQGASV